mgnify:CR=1 FL=1
MENELINTLHELSEAIRELTAELRPKESPKLEDVRAVLAEISKQGKTAEMKALLTKYGATKLSEVNPKDYAELLASAKEIANA